MLRLICRIFGHSKRTYVHGGYHACRPEGCYHRSYEECSRCGASKWCNEDWPGKWEMR